eukprot:Skav233972  [mRNA]  locus=scaffold1008:623090:627688:+ [translate_table: standard]
MQCVGWVTYSASPRVAAEYYGFENPKASIDMYLPVAPLVGYLVAKRANNLWGVILSGATLTAMGLVLRLVPNIIGMQALNGAAGPMNCVTPSALAAQWFPSSQRAVATSAVYAAQMAGPCVGFVLALLLVPTSATDTVGKGGDHLVLLMFVEAGAALAVVVTWALLPREPKVPPSFSQELRSTDGSGAGASPPSSQRWISTVILVLAGSGLASNTRGAIPLACSNAGLRPYLRSYKGCCLKVY